MPKGDPKHTSLNCTGHASTYRWWSSDAALLCSEGCETRGLVAAHFCKYKCFAAHAKTKQHAEQAENVGRIGYPGSRFLPAPFGPQPEAHANFLREWPWPVAPADVEKHLLRQRPYFIAEQPTKLLDDPTSRLRHGGATLAERVQLFRAHKETLRARASYLLERLAWEEAGVVVAAAQAEAVLGAKVAAALKEQAENAVHYGTTLSWICGGHTGLQMMEQLMMNGSHTLEDWVFYAWDLRLPDGRDPACRLYPQCFQCGSKTATWAFVHEDLIRNEPSDWVEWFQHGTPPKKGELIVPVAAGGTWANTPSWPDEVPGRLPAHLVHCGWCGPPPEGSVPILAARDREVYALRDLIKRTAPPGAMPELVDLGSQRPSCGPPPASNISRMLLRGLDSKLLRGELATSDHSPYTRAEILETFFEPQQVEVAAAGDGGAGPSSSSASSSKPPEAVAAAARAARSSNGDRVVKGRRDVDKSALREYSSSGSWGPLPHYRLLPQPRSNGVISLALRRTYYSIHKWPPGFYTCFKDFHNTYVWVGAPGTFLPGHNARSDACSMAWQINSTKPMQAVPHELFPSEQLEAAVKAMRDTERGAPVAHWTCASPHVLQWVNEYAQSLATPPYYTDQTTKRVLLSWSQVQELKEFVAHKRGGGGGEGSEAAIVEVYQCSGEMLTLPAGWWHQVINLGACYRVGWPVFEVRKMFSYLQLVQHLSGLGLLHWLASDDFHAVGPALVESAELMSQRLEWGERKREERRA